MKKILLIIIVLFIYFNYLKSETISGFITNTNNEVLEEVLIINKKNFEHTHSNNLGYYKLNSVLTGDTIQFRRFSYENYEIVITTFDKEFNIKMKTAPFEFSQIVITPDIKSLNTISEIDSKNAPVNSSQEVLRKIPGLIIGQHAGGGKAEQIFMRGFDMDHGTDINVSVDGMPVNMVSHAHGQGYADLHFLIPEVIEKIDYGKGPYYSDKGDFATGGYVNFETIDNIEQNKIIFEDGKFDYKRIAGLFDLLGNNGVSSAYIATEYSFTDGPFENPQNFNRLNMMAKYTTKINHSGKLSILLSTFYSKWDASGQIPERAVDKGIISRWGSLDNDEGGITGRSIIIINYLNTIDSTTYYKMKAYYSSYNFELYSDFTFFLKDSVNGDEIRQKENRNIYGYETQYSKNYKFGDLVLDNTICGGFRFDEINGDELSHTLNRLITLQHLSLADINESNLYGFYNINISFGNFIINPVLRYDFFNFSLDNKLTEVFSYSSQEKATISPKLNFIYNPDNNFQLFLKLGKGFHSNDARVVIAQQAKDILPAAYGADFGTILITNENLILNLALWYLYLEQEFVYVGDDAVVEPSGRTRRLGFDFGARYQISSNLFLNFDLNYSNARYIDEPNGNNYLPLAPVFTSTGGISLKNLHNIFASLSYRYVSDKPANQNFNLTAKGYFLLDGNINYTYEKFNFALIAENLLNVNWMETQFATISRLKNEPAPIEDIDFIPGTPFNLKCKISFNF